MNKSGTWLVLAAALLWSTGGAAIKFVEADGVVVAAVRGLIAGLVFLPFIKPRRIRLSWNLVGLLFSYSLMNVSFVTATKWTTAANAIAIQYTAPFWIFVAQATMGWIRPDFRRTAPMIVIATGIMLFLLEPAQGVSFKGNLMAVVSGIGFALTIVFFRVMRDEHNVTLVSLSNLAAALVLIPLISSYGGWGQVKALDISDWICLLYLGAVQIGLAYVLYSRGLRTVDALRGSTLALVEPVLNPLWVFIILSEVPSGYGIAGAAVVLAGVAADLYLNKEQKR
jgi:drug/metabolite transporter (DMT)-like permease